MNLHSKSGGYTKLNWIPCCSFSAFNVLYACLCRGKLKWNWSLLWRAGCTAWMWIVLTSFIRYSLWCQPTSCVSFRCFWNRNSRHRFLENCLPEVLCRLLYTQTCTPPCRAEEVSQGVMASTGLLKVLPSTQSSKACFFFSKFHGNFSFLKNLGKWFAQEDIAFQNERISMVKKPWPKDLLLEVRMSSHCATPLFLHNYINLTILNTIIMNVWPKQKIKN